MHSDTLVHYVHCRYIERASITVQDILLTQYDKAMFLVSFSC